MTILSKQGEDLDKEEQALPFRVALSRDGISRAILTTVFVLSFLPYVIGLSMPLMLLAPISLWIYAYVVLPSMKWQQSVTRKRSVVTTRVVIFAFLMPVGGTIVACSAGDWRSVGYAILMGVTLFAVRAVMRYLTLAVILQVFSRAAMYSLLIFLFLDWHWVRESVVSGIRLNPPILQPNTIGFMFIAFASAFAWRLSDRSEKLLVRVLWGGLTVSAVAITFLASSRASLLALAMGAACAGSLWIGRAIRQRRVTKSVIVLTLAALVFAVLFSATLRPERVVTSARYVEKTLQLDSSYRGFGSGLSGRLPRWEATWHALLADGTWVVGAGYRTSEQHLGFSVDNGYLVVAYEVGVLGLIAIVGQLIWCLWVVSSSYRRSEYWEDRRLSLVVAALVVALLVNNIFDRYLFGIGNPFSLLALFLIVCVRSDFLAAHVGRIGYRSLMSLSDIVAENGGSRKTGKTP